MEGDAYMFYCFAPTEIVGQKTDRFKIKAIA